MQKLCFGRKNLAPAASITGSVRDCHQPLHPLSKYQRYPVHLTSQNGGERGAGAA